MIGKPEVVNVNVIAETGSAYLLFALVVFPQRFRFLPNHRGTPEVDSHPGIAHCHREHGQNICQDKKYDVVSEKSQS